VSQQIIHVTDSSFDRTCSSPNAGAPRFLGRMVRSLQDESRRSSTRSRRNTRPCRHRQITSTTPEDADALQLARHPDADPASRTRQAEGQKIGAVRKATWRLSWTASCERLPGESGRIVRKARSRRAAGPGTGNRGPRQDELPPDDFIEGGEDLDVISPAELERAGGR